MKTLLLILLITFSMSGIGQYSDSFYNIRIRTIKGNPLEAFIDSLKFKVYRDTLRFKRSDLLHTIIGTRNRNPYSPLYVVDAKYEYKLDIINGKNVSVFVNEILNTPSIDSIEILGASYCQTMFGSYGMNGAILIWTNKTRDLNFKIAGLVKNKKRYNNFFQREKGELIVSD